MWREQSGKAVSVSGWSIFRFRFIRRSRREELRFRFLRKTDLSPLNYKRVAEKDGEEASWDQIVEGYEDELGKYVVLKERDFQRVDLEATQTVDIQDFVDLEESIRCISTSRNTSNRKRAHPKHRRPARKAA
jgi:Ku70/Ku80 beta-barrel domain